MKSLKLLPLDKREKATVKQLLEALQIAESELKEYDEKSTKIIYRSMRITICEMAREIEELAVGNRDKKTRIIESEDKVFDRVLKFFVEAGNYDKIIESLRSKINPDEANKIDQESSVHPTIKFAKNG